MVAEMRPKYHRGVVSYVGVLSCVVYGMPSFSPLSFAFIETTCGPRIVRKRSSSSEDGRVPPLVACCERWLRGGRYGTYEAAA